MPSLADLMTDDRRAKLAREMTHSGQYNNDAIRAQRWQDIANAPGQYAQGMFTDYAGRMVDIANIALMPFGLDREKPVLGSRHLAELIGADESALPYKVAQYMPLDVGDIAMSAKMFAPALVAALGSTAIAAKASKGATLSDLAQAMPKQRGIFAGAGAKTADVVKLALAEKMKAQGIADDVIHKQTGWFFGMPDGKPRFEIPDDAAQITGKRGQYGGFELPSGAYPKSPMELMPHKQLQDAYPDVNNMDLSQSLLNGARDAGSRGGYDAGGTMTKYGATPERISLYDFPAQTTATAKSTTLHELQHAIQQREGFARGGSPEAELNAVFNNDKELQRLVTQAGMSKEAALRYLGKPEDIGYENYKRLAGEAEARLTQARMNMTPEQRLASYPPSMFDVPLDQQIVRYGDGTAMSTANIPKKLYRGIKTGYQSDGSEGYGTAMLGKGLYTSPSKKFASQYGDVIEISPEIAYPKNPLILPTGRGDARSTFMDWALKESGEKNAREFGKKYPDYSEFVRSRGFDGVVAGDEIVKYADTYDDLLSTAQKSVDDMRDKYIGYK